MFYCLYILIGIFKTVYKAIGFCVFPSHFSIFIFLPSLLCPVAPNNLRVFALSFSLPSLLKVSFCSCHACSSLVSWPLHIFTPIQICIIKSRRRGYTCEKKNVILRPDYFASYNIVFDSYPFSRKLHDCIVSLWLNVIQFYVCAIFSYPLTC